MTNENNVNKTQNTFAIVGFILSFFIAIAGLIVSIIGLKKSKEFNNGKGLSIAGIIISSLSIFFSLIVLIISFMLVFSNMKSIDKYFENVNSIQESMDSYYNYDEEDNKIYTLGETFEFDDLEITIGTDYSFVIVNNEESPYHNHTAVKLPVTIKNLSNDTNLLNEYYYKINGSNDEDLINLSVYFLDDAIDSGDNLNYGESYTKYMYFLYVGNGKYEIEFDNYHEEVDVQFNIIKN